MLYDLNIPYDSTSKEDLIQRLNALSKLGYHAAALNHQVEGKLPKATCSFRDFKAHHLTESPLRIYTRLTLVLSDPQQNYGINSGNEVIRSYDILAVQPETEKMFISACTNLEIDIISLDLSVRLPFAVKAGYLRQALSRGIAFEILYGPIVADATSRRNAIGNARLLTRLVLGKKGFLVTSGGTNVWQLRSPLDVMNLMGLLGIPSHLRKDCLRKIPEAVFMHAASRRHAYRSAVMITEEPVSERKEKKVNDETDMLGDFIELQ